MYEPDLSKPFSVYEEPSAGPWVIDVLWANGSHASFVVHDEADASRITYALAFSDGVDDTECRDLSRARKEVA